MKISRLESRHVALDSETSGEQRGNYLTRPVGADGIEAVVGGKLLGYAIPGIDSGFMCSASDEKLIEPLMAEISRANEYMHSLGYTSRDGAIRMALGNDPIRKIRSVAGTISSSIG